MYWDLPAKMIYFSHYTFVIPITYEMVSICLGYCNALFIDVKFFGMVPCRRHLMHQNTLACFVMKHSLLPKCFSLNY